MRIVTYGDNEYCLSEVRYRQLLKRFDASRAILNAFGQYFIPVKSFCWDHKFECLKCQLRSPQKKIVSCSYLFTKVIGEDLSRYVYIFDVGILWNPQYDRYAREALRKIRDLLMAARKTKQERYLSPNDAPHH